MEKEQQDKDIEIELCPGCLNENIPGTHFCNRCGSPLSSFAAIGPWERIQAERHIYANAASNPQSLISLLGIWLIFGGMFGIGIALSVILLFEWPDLYVYGALWELLMIPFLIFVGGFVTIRTTRNYIKIKKRKIKLNSKYIPDL